MQVFSFGYYLPRVSVVICAKFGEDPMTDPLFVDIEACNVCQDRTYPVHDQTSPDRHYISNFSGLSCTQQCQLIIDLS
jgi:hypothetical protein